MNPSTPQSVRLSRMVTITALATSLGMTLYEAITTFFLPALTLWESHVITIGFSTLLATAVVHVVLRKRRTVAQNIQAEQLRAQEIVRQAREGILIVNKRGQVLSLNPAAEHLFGYGSAEVQNQPVSLLFREPPSTESRKVLHDSLPVGTVLGLAAGAREMIGQRKNGETFPIELTTSSVTSGDDSVSVLFARDVSKRKQAQRYLTAHYAATCILAETRSLAEALPRIMQAVCEALHFEAGSFWRLDADAGLLRCAGVYQAPVTALPQPLDLEPLTCRPGQGLSGRAWATAQPVWVENLLKTDDYPCRTVATALQAQGAFAFPIVMDQKVCGTMAFFSRRKLRKDEQLLGIMAELGKQIGQFIARKQDEEKLQALVQASPVAINILDLQGNVRLWNPAAERLLGWSKAECLGRPVPWNAEQHPSAAAENGAAFSQGKTLHGESRVCRRKDGKPIQVRLSAAPLRNAEGTIFGTVIMVTDLTEQRRLEEQLRQAQKMEAIGQLAGGIAHDFNNLLTIINGYSEVLLGRLKPGDPAQDCAAQVKRAGERAACLTRQLLAFSRKQTLQVQDLDLNVLVHNVEKMLRRLIGEHIETVVRENPLPGLVKADPSQIEQVLFNLAVNARDAMPEGGILTLAISNVDLDDTWAQRQPEAAPGPYVQLTVQDTGCGMDAATKAHLFEPFFTTKEVGKGTGLGLATVYGIVKQSGGHIEVESELGQGTTFRVYLPRLAGKRLDCAEPEKRSHVPYGKETVLVVEDEDGVRRFLQDSLQLNGYHVLEARSGKDALKLCAEHKGGIDLLLTDVIMPQMNGRQLAEHALALQPDLSVLYISGYTDHVLDDQGVVAPDIELLHKPVLPRALAHKVREVLDRRRPAWTLPCRATASA